MAREWQADPRPQSSIEDPRFVTYGRNVTDDPPTPLEVALNEADVLGLRLDQNGRWCDLLVEVRALPETGPIDRDPRRVLRLLTPATVKVLLRRDKAGHLGPVVPLRDIDEVEVFFSSLAWTGSMYGWSFFDDPALTADWSVNPSLTIDLRDEAGTRTLYWFNECGREEQHGKVAYCIEGLVSFEDLQVLDANDQEQPLEEFIADGVRWWRAFYDGDERLSPEAQREAQRRALTWRPSLYTAATGRVRGGGQAAPAPPPDRGP